MNQKNVWIGAGIIAVVAVLAVGGYVMYNKLYPTASSPSTKSQNLVTAVNNAVVKTKTDTSVGQYLTDQNAKTLYTYASDSSGVSNCKGSCLASWPAYQNTGSMTGLPADISTIMRSDNNQMQFTYKGMPLYYFVQDGSGQ